ncbi:MAG: hypothetical protein ACLTRR_16950 [Flavonifractor plautii]
MNQSNLLTVRVAGVMNRQAVVLHAGRTLPCLLSGRLLRRKIAWPWATGPRRRSWAAASTV